MYEDVEQPTANYGAVEGLAKNMIKDRLHGNDSIQKKLGTKTQG